MHFSFELDGLRIVANTGGEARDAAIILSFALQHGADIDEIRALCRNSAGRALGPIGQALDILANSSMAI